MYYNHVGFIFLMYGIAKIIIVISLMFIPVSIKKKLADIEGADFFISGDVTLAGHMYEYVLLTFAIFSVIHGMALLGAFPEKIHHTIERKAFQYPFYIFLGLWLMIFYGLVIYTQVPIEKDPNQMRNYKIYCYPGGLSFLLVPVVWEIIEYLNPYLNRMSQERQLVYMTVFMLAAIFVIFLIYIVTKRMYDMYVKKRRASTKPQEKSV